MSKGECGEELGEHFERGKEISKPAGTGVSWSGKTGLGPQSMTGSPS